MAIILTTLGERDDAELVKRAERLEDDEMIVDTVEYCLPSCDGRAHMGNVPDATSHFCDRHIHRSVHVTMKQWPAGLGAVIGDFGG